MIALEWNERFQAADLVNTGSGLARDDTLATAIIVSLFTDARARPDDILPSGESDRRGWVGDTLSEDGDRIGSRLWLLRRAKQTEETRRRAIDYAREALAWIVKRGLARTIEVSAQWIGRGLLALSIAIVMPGSQTETYSHIVSAGA
ncbi:phage GP46 family protein [Parvibaculum sp.]|uniref:phage GP46 family protein n=1 Tax=Parvibaculum sp. TaxID=2024848 RepID=UPI0027361AA4|nr:phage GP46 family protein [Parvibaculum sp.]MDP3329426.1 phage GP46 family protein [Parvibaculum sp.]